jgi:hypothetical protein
MTEPAKCTQQPGRDKHKRPAATTMSDQECAAIRQSSADDARRMTQNHSGRMHRLVAAGLLPAP